MFQGDNPRIFGIGGVRGRAIDPWRFCSFPQILSPPPCPRERLPAPPAARAAGPSGPGRGSGCLEGSAKGVSLGTGKQRAGPGHASNARMLQRRPRPRPGHALKKLASPRPCTFQSVDGGSRVCGGSLRPSRRTPLRKGRVPKPSARDAPSAVCDPIDTHSSHVCAAADRRCARTPSGGCLNRRRRWPRAGFRAGWAFVGDGFSCGVGGPSWAGAEKSRGRE